MRTTLSVHHYLPDDEHLAEYEEAVLIVAKRRVIRLLFQSFEPLTVSQILEKINISLNSLAAIYVELSHIGMIERRDSRYFLTNRGRRWVIKNRKSIFMERKAVTYRDLTLPPSKVSLRIEGKKSLPKKYFMPEIDNDRRAR